MTSSDNISANPYSYYGNANAYSFAPSSANFNSNSNSPSYRDPGYFQPYQGLSTDGFTGGYGLYRPDSASVSYSQKQPLNDMTALARIQVISNELDQQSTGQTDGTIALGDLKQALADESGKYSKEDKEAIQYLLDNQNGMRGRLDGFDGEADAMMTVDSINKLVANPNAQPEKEKTPEQKMTNTEALSKMADYMGTAINNGTADKYVDKHGKLVASQRGAWSTDRQKLQKMSEDPAVPEDVRIAAKKLLTNDELFKKVDTAHKNGEPDGRISLKDCQTAINKVENIDDIGNTPSSGSASGSGAVIQSASVGSYPPVYTGNSNLDYYYNNIYGSAVGPASDAYRQAPGGQQKAA